MRSSAYTVCVVNCLAYVRLEATGPSIEVVRNYTEHIAARTQCQDLAP